MLGSAIGAAPRGGPVVSPRGELWSCSPDLRERLTDEFWRRVHDDDRAAVERVVAEAASREDPGFDLEYRVVTTQGDVRWVRDRAFAVRGTSGRVERLVGIAEDVTDARAAQDLLDAARRQLAHSERLAALGSMVAGLAHEVRTPLAAAMNHVSIVSARVSRVVESAPGTAAGAAARGLEDVPGHVAATMDALDRINRLVEGLRRFTRSDPTQARERSGLEGAVAEALRLFQSAHRGRVDVVSDLGATTPLLLDKVQVEQLVLRLLENAADAMASGVVRVSTRETPLAVELVVEDHGVGIPRDAQPRVFDEFFTTKPGRTGLGLSIARRIVEAHGGTIALRSVPNEGTTVVASFPKPRPNGPRQG